MFHQSHSRSLGIVLLLAVALLSFGCDLITGGKKAAKTALEDLKKLQAIAKVGVDQKEYANLHERAKKSSNDALGKLDDGDIKSALQDAIDGYTDGKTVLETPGQINTAIAPFSGFITKYSFKAPSQFVLQFALLQKIFDKSGKAVNRLTDSLR